jgi:hypothetical protein
MRAQLHASVPCGSILAFSPTVYRSVVQLSFKPCPSAAPSGAAMGALEPPMLSAAV